GAGIYAAFGGAAVALVDAGTFVFSAATLVALKFTEPPAAPREHHFLREVSAGLEHVARTRLLRELTLGTGVTMLVIGFSETLIFAVVGSGLHRPPSFIGVLSVCEGIGSVLGGLSAGWLLRSVGEVRMTGIGVALFAFADAFLAL